MILAIKKCANCGKDVQITHKTRLTHKTIFCCKKCEGEYRKKRTLKTDLEIMTLSEHTQMHAKKKKLAS